MNNSLGLIIIHILKLNIILSVTIIPYIWLLSLMIITKYIQLILALLKSLYTLKIGMELVMHQIFLKKNSIRLVFILSYSAHHYKNYQNILILNKKIVFSNTFFILIDQAKRYTHFKYIFQLS